MAYLRLADTYTYMLISNIARNRARGATENARRSVETGKWIKSIDQYYASNYEGAEAVGDATRTRDRWPTGLHV